LVVHTFLYAVEKVINVMLVLLQVDMGDVVFILET